MSLPNDEIEHKIKVEQAAEQAAEQQAFAQMAQTLAEPNQPVLAALCGSFDGITERVIEKIFVFLPDSDLVIVQKLNRTFKKVIDKSPFLQEKLRTYAVESIKLVEQKNYLNNDLVKYRIRKGVLTLKQALNNINSNISYWEKEFIKLGFSSFDLIRKDTSYIPTPYYSFNRHNQYDALLKKYIGLLNDEDKKKSEEDRKINAEKLSSERGEKIEAFFNTIWTWSQTRAYAFLADFTIEKVNKLPNHSDFTVAHVEKLKKSSNFEGTLSEIKDLKEKQLVALENPLGFSEKWIKSASFSVDAYNAFQTFQSLPREQRIKASEFESLNSKQISLLLKGMALAEVKQLSSSQEDIDLISEGLNVGFTLEDVRAAWFSKAHIAANRGSLLAYYPPNLPTKIPLDQLRTATIEEVYGLAAGLTLEQIKEVQQQLGTDIPVEKMKIIFPALAKGFSLKDVQSDWYTDHHLSICQANNFFSGIHTGETRPTFSPAQVRGLNINQILGLNSGLTIEQVSHPGYINMGEEASWRVTLGLKKEGVTFEQIVSRFAKMDQLKPWQLKCINDSGSSIRCVLTGSGSSIYSDNEDTDHITSEQVQQPWFTPEHAIAIEFSYGSYSEIEGLSLTQLEGLRVGLSYEQVNHDWFMIEHLAAIKDRIPYESIAELSTKEVRELRDRISEERVFNARAIRVLNASSPSVCSSNSGSAYEEHKRSPTVILMPNSPGAKVKQEAADAALAEQLAFQAQNEQNRVVALHMRRPSDEMPH